MMWVGRAARQFEDGRGLSGDLPGVQDAAPADFLGFGRIGRLIVGLLDDFRDVLRAGVAKILGFVEDDASLESRRDDGVDQSVSPFGFA
jgi:hypothetical protein